MAKDNVVMVTWANLHYLDFVLNWVAHLQRADVSTFLVGAMDDALLQVRACACVRACGACTKALSPAFPLMNHPL